ncbi:hypothetical protein AAER74_27760, partial [Klebsiella pneumoniae]
PHPPTRRPRHMCIIDSVQTVRATLSLLDATQAVRDAVESGTVTVTQARQLASLKPEEHREKVSESEAATAGTHGHEKPRRQLK